MDMQHTIGKRLRESAELKTRVAETLSPKLEVVAREIIARIKRGGTVYICGNGGSNCDAQHIAGELMVRFYKNRAAIPALALDTNPGVITAIGNDFSFEQCFSRQVGALVRGNDVLIAISTSGNSPNILAAAAAAKAKGAWVLGMSGKTGGALAPLCDEMVLVPSSDTPRIQEVHITVAHILCELIEQELFP